MSTLYRKVVNVPNFKLLLIIVVTLLESKIYKEMTQLEPHTGPQPSSIFPALNNVHGGWPCFCYFILWCGGFWHSVTLPQFKVAVSPEK